MQVSDELARLFANLSRTLHREASAGMQPTEFFVLRTLSLTLDGLRLSDLAEVGGLDVSTMSRRVASLIERGLVHKDQHPSDRRAAVLTVTQAGRDRLSAERSRRVALITNTLSEWDASDMDQLAGMLCRLNASIEAAYE